MSEPVQVNFNHTIPLFPLPDTVLLPHAVLPLHIFEPRYVQMVSRCLDRAGQIAIGTIVVPPRRRRGTSEGAEPATPGTLPVLPATCVGQIIQHQVLDDGGYNILLHGVCRARILEVLEPRGERTFRLARLSPIEPADEPSGAMTEERDALRTLLCSPRLRRLRAQETLLEWIDREDVPTDALLELIGFAVVRDTDRKYRLLAEPDPHRRADMIRSELLVIDRIVRRAERCQEYRSWPKGMSWN